MLCPVVVHMMQSEGGEVGEPTNHTGTPVVVNNALFQPGIVSNIP